MSKHTPGPWSLDLDDGRAGILGPSDGFSAPVLGTVYDIDLPDGAANARLIAAAPDLLAALREIAGFANELSWNPRTRLFAERIHELTAPAIAKAEGRDA